MNLTRNKYLNYFIDYFHSLQNNRNIEHFKHHYGEKIIHDIELIDNPFVKRIHEKVESYILLNNLADPNKFKLTTLYSSRYKFTSIISLYKYFYEDSHFLKSIFEIFRISIYKDTIFFHIPSIISVADYKIFKKLLSFNKIETKIVYDNHGKSMHHIFQITEEELMQILTIFDKMFHNFFIKNT